MDREAKDQYLLVIQAKDMVGQNGGLSGTTSVTVTLTDVNDNPPRFPRRKLFNEMTKFKNNFTVFTFFSNIIFLSYLSFSHISYPSKFYLPPSIAVPPVPPSLSARSTPPPFICKKGKFFLRY